MVGYLDYNVFVDIEDGRTSIRAIENNIKQIEAFPFSAAHIQETDNIAYGEKADLFIEKRLNTIKTVSKGLYLYHKLPSNEILWLLKEPKDILEVVRTIPWGKEAMKVVANFVPSEEKTEIRDKFGIDVKALNNFTTEEAISYLNTRLQEWGMGENFMEMMDKVFSFFPDTTGFGRHNKIAGIIEMLDLLGFWKDRATPTSNHARQWDANHVHFASYCDYFISNDKRLRNKAKVVYALLDIPTKVVSSEGKD